MPYRRLRLAGALIALGIANLAEAQVVTRVNLATSGTEAQGGPSAAASLSADGRFVVFESTATNLVVGDTNAVSDVFLRDRQTNQTVRISVAPGNGNADGSSYSPAISGDGRWLAFLSDATNLVSGDGNGRPDVFLFDRSTGLMQRIDSGGWPRRELALSGNGDLLAYAWRAGIYAKPVLRVVDRSTGQATTVTYTDYGCSIRPAFSSDGRFLSFEAIDCSAISARGAARKREAILHDRVTAQSQRMSIAPDGSASNGDSGRPTISADGRFVAFESRATNLGPSDPNGNRQDIYVRQVSNGQMTRVSQNSGGFYGHALSPALDGTGTWLAFQAFGVRATATGPAGYAGDVYLFHVPSGTTRRLSDARTGGPSTGISLAPKLSADGSALAFTSESSDLVNGDTNANDDVFVHTGLAPCAYTLTPAGANYPAGGTGVSAPSQRIAVDTPAGCLLSWTGVSQASWIHINPNSNGPGSGEVYYRVDANPGSQPRTGTIAIGGQTFTVTQAGISPGTCTYQLSATSLTKGIAGGPSTLAVSAAPACAWTGQSQVPWVTVTGGGNGSGNGVLGLLIGANTTGAVRTGSLLVAGQSVTVTQTLDSVVYLAEGATGSFFDTQLAIFNPNDQAATVTLRFLKETSSVAHILTLPGHRRATLDVETVAGMENANFSTVIESSLPVVVDRTMSWGVGSYGSHAETAIPAPSTIWYLAEGSTSGDFSLFYLLQNPEATPVTVTIRYLRPLGLPPIESSVMLAPTSRTTIAVDSAHPDLANTDVSAVVTATGPIIVERAMYRTRGAQVFAAGHESAGVTAPSLNWFLAEGATGPFFDLFILLANPGSQPADVAVDYLLSSGVTHAKNYTVPANGRLTIWVDDEQIPAGSGVKPLDNVAVSTTVRSTNGVPIIVERAMWWPGPAVSADFWIEAHNSPGATSTGTRWALAEGETGGPLGAETYILIANTSATAGSARVTLYFEDGTSAAKVVALLPRSRLNVGVAIDFPSSAGRRFGAIVESLGPSPAEIVVERAMYTSPGGVTWAAGTNALATRLP